MKEQSPESPDERHARLRAQEAAMLDMLERVVLSILVHAGAALPGIKPHAGKLLPEPSLRLQLDAVDTLIRIYRCRIALLGLNEDDAIDAPLLGTTISLEVLALRVLAA